MKNAWRRRANPTPANWPFNALGNVVLVLATSAAVAAVWWVVMRVLEP